MQRVRRVLPGVLLLLMVACVALFVVLPLGRMAALVTAQGTGVADILSELASQTRIIVGSVAVALASSVLSTLIALCVSLSIVFGNHRVGRALTAISVTSIVSPPFVSSLAYIMLFGRRGLVTHGVFGLDVSPYGWQGIVVMQALFFTAINVLMLTTVLRRVDASVLDASRDLGASWNFVLRDVLLPLLRPTLMACLLLTFVRSLSDYGTPVVIGGSFETIASQIYLQVVGYSDLGMAALLNVLLMAVALLAFVAFGRLSARSGRLVSSSSGPRIAAVEGSLRMRGALARGATLVACLFLAFMVVLYATIVRTAFSSGIGWQVRPTLSNLAHLATFDMASLFRSLWYAIVAAIASTLFSLLVAYFVHRRRVPGGRALEFVVTMPYLIPGSCFGLGYLLTFNMAPLKLTGTAAIIVIVLTFKQLTISEQTFSAALGQVSREVDMAARDLGASEARCFLDVIVPNLRGAALVGLINTFSTSMVAYGAVLFLVSPRHKVAVFELFDSLSSGKYGEAAMISLGILAVTLVVNAALALSMSKRRC